MRLTIPSSNIYHICHSDESRNLVAFKDSGFRIAHYLLVRNDREGVKSCKIM